jgi:uncharacterized protein (DUF2147 family)
MWWQLRALFAIAGLTLFLAGAARAADVAGLWLTAEGESQIEIYPCDSALCGRIAYLKEPFDESGNPKVDENNPDPALRARPVVGLTIMTGLLPADRDNRWQGVIYSPRNGETYNVTLTLEGDRLEIEGCMLYVLCDSQYWTRVR